MAVALHPAAFGRLCVETRMRSTCPVLLPQPPSGGCVLKLRINHQLINLVLTAAFGRLCVETRCATLIRKTTCASRLRAAVC